MVDPGFQNGGPRFSLWWTAVFSENFGGPRFGGPRFSEEPGLVDPGLVDPGLLGWIPVSVNDLAVLNRPKYKGI